MKDIVTFAEHAALIILPFALLIIAWAVIVKLLKKKKSVSKTISISKIAPPYIARRVLYKKELYDLKASQNDLAYVLKENQTYFYNGDEWLKVETKQYPKTDGAMGN